MILDYEQELTTANGQAITGNAYGTKPYDQKSAHDGAVGEPLDVFMECTENFDQLTSLDVILVNDDDGAGSNEVVLVTKNFLAAALTVAAGVRRVGRVSPGVAAKRYLTAKLGVNGTDPNNGKIRVWFTKGSDMSPSNAGTSL